MRPDREDDVQPVPDEHTRALAREAARHIEAANEALKALREIDCELQAKKAEDDIYEALQDLRRDFDAWEARGAA